MFWALEQRQKRQKAFRDEIAAQVKREIGDEVRQDMLDQAQRIIIEQAKRELIQQIEPIAKSKGIPTEELLKALDETPANPKE